MTDSTITTTTHRQYRLAQGIVVVGSLAIGSLVVDRIVDSLHQSFFLYYGVSDAEYQALQSVGTAELPLKVGHLSVAVIALIGTIFFVVQERLRVRRIAPAVARSDAAEVTTAEPLPFRMWFDLFVTRTSAFGGVLLALWLLRTCFERFIGGAGWGLEYAGWMSLLPLASIFGVCVIAGMVVALASLVGLRAISVLEIVLRSIHRALLRNVSCKLPRTWIALRRIVSFRDRFGCDILSRPPPVAAA